MNHIFKLMALTALAATHVSVDARTMLSSDMRAQLIATTMQTCQADQIIRFLKSDPSTAAALPAQFDDPARFPLTEFREKMQSDPATAKIDRGIEEGCSCAVKPMHDAYRAARTMEEVSTYHKRLNGPGNNKHVQHVKACWTRVNAKQ